jgi:hypothetical protein
MTVEDDDAAVPPAGALPAGVPPAAKVTPGAEAAVIENENPPEGAPPTAHDSCHAPMSPAPAVPDFEKFPDPSVEPMDVPEKLPDGMEPETVTGAFGVAPVMAISQVSPT